jgi:hypothetical protein
MERIRSLRRPNLHGDMIPDHGHGHSHNHGHEKIELKHPQGEEIGRTAKDEIEVDASARSRVELNVSMSCVW